MQNSHDLQDNPLIRALIDSFISNVCILDEEGYIVEVNRAWEAFAVQNNGDKSRVGVGVNYLQVCEQALGEGQAVAQEFEQAVRQVIKREKDSFQIEYPCHSPHIERWFLGRVTPLEVGHEQYHKRSYQKVIIEHVNITNQKLAEKVAQEKEAQLRRSEVKYRSIVNQSVEMLFLHDLKGSVVDVNLMAVKQTGYTREELLELTVFDLDPNAIERDDVDWEGMRPGDDPFIIEVTHQRKDGSTYPAEITLGKIEIEGEEYILALAREITERKKMEEALWEQNQLLDGIFESIQEGICVVNPDLTVRYVNHTIKEWHPEQIPLEGKKCHQAFHNKGKPCAGCPVVRALNSGKKEYEETTTWTHYGEKWVEIHAYPMRSDTGSIEAVVESVRDITDRKKYEIELKKQKIRSDALFEYSSDAVVKTDSDHRISAVNDTFTRLFGYTLDEVRGKRLDEIVTRDKEEKPFLMSVLATGKNITGESIRYTKAGTPIHVILNGTPIIVDGEIEGGYVVYTDITERKKAEERIRYLSFHDKLTGLYNRTFLEEELQRLNTDRQLPIAIIMADLNGLKLVNDTYGHTVGDEMLKQAAEILRNSCRQEDILARWGGDEFVILLPQTSPVQAKHVCNRIELNSQNQYLKDIPISLALGFAVKEEASEVSEASERDLEDTLKEAEDDMYKQKLAESRSIRSGVLNALLKTLETKSYETEAHTRRMQETALKIGERVGLSSSELNRLNLLITLHDIGKINIQEEVLTKNDSLSDEEWEIIKKHPETGYRIARATEEFGHVAEDILAHHEHWDGKGYPRGIGGKQIPLLARIVAIADAYEVMANGRPYKTPLSHNQVKEEFKRCAGSQFDPYLVDVFLEILDGDLKGEDKS